MLFGTNTRLEIHCGRGDARASGDVNVNRIIVGAAVLTVIVGVEQSCLISVSLQWHLPCIINQPIAFMLFELICDEGVLAQRLSIRDA